MADVQRFAGQSRIDIRVAIQEVVLTILLQRIYTSSLRDHLAFKGGTALRKLVFGSAGRFSEDLDFAVLTDDYELVQLELEQYVAILGYAALTCIQIPPVNGSGPAEVSATRSTVRNHVVHTLRFL